MGITEFIIRRSRDPLAPPILRSVADRAPGGVRKKPAFLDLYRTQFVRHRNAHKNVKERLLLRDVILRTASFRTLIC